MLAPYLLGRRGPGRYVPGSGDGDGLEEQPIITTTSTGDTTISGKVKPGSFGKFVFPLATITAGRQYTFRYDPNFSQLALQGKLAMVGFGLKNGNDFHIVGLRGDGSTGLKKYRVTGTPPNGWNKQTGHTETDGGTPANGTQAGPNYIRLIVSSDGATYKFSTSPDNSAWTEEFTGITPTPFSNVSGVVTFGLALWFNNSDAGPFSIVIDQFADAAAPTGPVITYIGRINSGSGSINIGGAGETRMVVMTSEHSRSVAPARLMASATIGGVNAPIIRQIGSATSGAGAAIMALETTANGSVAFATTLNGAAAAQQLDIYTITGYSINLAWDSAEAVGNNPSLTIDFPQDGVALACGSGHGAGAFTWTGLATEDSDVDISSTYNFGAAHSSGLAATSGATISLSGAGSDEAIAAVSWGGSLGGVTADYTGQGADNAAVSTTRTISNVAIGAADAGRLVVAAITMESTAASAAITGVTIGGVTATVHVSKNDGVRFPYAAIASAVVPTGTTATVVITSGTNMSKAAVALHRLIGYSATPFDTDNPSGGSPNISIDIASKGYVVMASANRLADTAPSWTGDGVTQDFRLTTAGGDGNTACMAAAHHWHGGAETAFAANSAGSLVVCAAASFQPT